MYLWNSIRWPVGRGPKDTDTETAIRTNTSLTSFIFQKSHYNSKEAGTYRPIRSRPPRARRHPPWPPPADHRQTPVGTSARWPCRGTAARPAGRPGPPPCRWMGGRIATTQSGGDAAGGFPSWARTGRCRLRHRTGWGRWFRRVQRVREPRAPKPRRSAVRSVRVPLMRLA